VNYSDSLRLGSLSVDGVGGSADGQCHPEQAKAGMDAWMAWAGKAGGAIVELGAPLVGGRHVQSGSSSSGRTQIRGYSILQVGRATTSLGFSTGIPIS
jgi:hypothetical protein